MVWNGRSPFQKILPPLLEGEGDKGDEVIITGKIQKEKKKGSKQMNIYKAIWSVIGGRPWSYILRDIWHKYEGLCILFMIGVGAVLGHWLWQSIWWLLLTFTLGYIAGHLFWGKDYIPDQKGE